MKRQSSLHNNKSSPFLKKIIPNQQSSLNSQILNQNYLKDPQNLKDRSLSQSKIPFATKLPNQYQKAENNFLMTTPNSFNMGKKQLLKRGSLFRNQNEIKQSFEQSQRVNKQNKLNAKQGGQISESNNMFLTNIEQKQGGFTDQNNMIKLLYQTGYQSAYTSGSSTPKGKVTAESKWQKIIELYTMRQQLAKKFQFPSAFKLRKQYPILPSGQFYKILGKPRVFQKQWKINFPQTIFQDNDGNTLMIYTDSKGIFRRNILQKQGEKKQKYRTQVLKWRQQLIQTLHQEGKVKIFKEIKIDENPNIPLSIMKYSEDNSYQFETQVQSYRNFMERKQKPTRDSVMQRYIFSNNLKAMVFRLYYNRQTNGKSGGSNKPQYTGIRFENEKPIFKESTSNSFCDTHKLTSTITLSNQRINSIKLIPITNPKTLLKYIPMAKQLQKLLQYTQKLLIDKLYIDFIVDIFDKPWIINIKYCEINQNSKLKSPVSQDHTHNVGPCRLCGTVVKKQQLKNSVSVKMLCEFIHHLKKRTKQEEMHKIQFIQNLNINSMENKSSSVCKICYKVIIHELELIKMEKKLAQICNIIPTNNQEYLEPNHKAIKNNNVMGQYKQWRLMLYFQDIKNVQLSMKQNSSNFFNTKSVYYGSDFLTKPQNSKVETQYFLKYELGPKISQSFLCKKQNSLGVNLKINQVKLHYFYSQTTKIQDFINNTEIIVSLYSAEVKNSSNNHFEFNHQGEQFERYEKVYHNEKLLASGSTHILSNFNLHKTSSCSLKTLMQNGQKQTATVLLFFQNRKYCELSLKVGLVYDGSYNVSGIPTKRENGSNEFSQFIKLNEVWFSRGLWNSNPLPKQWMEIFGSKYNYDGNSDSILKEYDGQGIHEEQILKSILEDSDSENSNAQ